MSKRREWAKCYNVFVIQYSTYERLCAICISSSSVHPIVEQTQEERQNFDVWWHEEHSNEK